MYSQVVGKVRLEASPMTNHWWQVPLYLTARGLTTSPIAHGDKSFQLDFDLFDHELVVFTSEGETRRIPLGSAVKSFYRQVMATLEGLGVGEEGLLQRARSAWRPGGVALHRARGRVISIH